MKEKIYKYLKDEQRSVNSDEILREFFGVRGDYPSQMEAIVVNTIGADQRFIRDETGSWRINDTIKEQKLSEMTFLIAEIVFIPIKKNVLQPALLGLLQLINGKTQPIEYYLFEPHNRIKMSSHADEFRKAISFDENARQLFDRLHESIIVSFASTKTVRSLQYELRCKMNAEFESSYLPLNKLMQRLFPGLKIRSVEELGNHFGLLYTISDRLQDRLSLIADLLMICIDEFARLNIDSYEKLTEFLNAPLGEIDYSKYAFDEMYLQQIPLTPGVYLMRDEADHVFYVGKAKRLAARISSYFINMPFPDKKLQTIRDRLFRIEYEQAGSELEALLLEFNYIQKYSPELNIQIQINAQQFQDVISRKIILIIPSQIDNNISLFMLTTEQKARKVVINKIQYDQNEVNSAVKEFYFSGSEVDHSLTDSEIEIIWRWLKQNQEQVNYLDVEKTAGFVDCCNKLHRYIADKNIASDKIVYY